jgi:hypothetical protein
VAEYNVLISALNSVWSASLTQNQPLPRRAIGRRRRVRFSSQGGVDPSTFLALALLVFVLVLFLGIAKFARLVEIQRELMVYIAGMNTIRYFFQEVAPASRPYFVLPIYDDGPALYRSIGTGLSRKRPKVRTPSPDRPNPRHCGDCHRRGGRRLRSVRGLACRECHGLVRSDFGFPW